MSRMGDMRSVVAMLAGTGTAGQEFGLVRPLLDALASTLDHARAALDMYVQRGADARHAVMYYRHRPGPTHGARSRLVFVQAVVQPPPATGTRVYIGGEWAMVTDVALIGNRTRVLLGHYHPACTVWDSLVSPEAAPPEAAPEATPEAAPEHDAEWARLLASGYNPFGDD